MPDSSIKKGPIREGAAFVPVFLCEGEWVRVDDFDQLLPWDRLSGALGSS